MYRQLPLRDVLALNYATNADLPPASVPGRLGYVVDEAALYLDDGNSWTKLEGTVSDPDALHDGDFTSNGILVRSAADTYTSRTLTGTAKQVIVTNGTGAAGNPTLSLPQDIATDSSPTFASATLTGSLHVAGALHLTGLSVITAEDGETTAVSDGTTTIVLLPEDAATATHTVELPATPADGQLLLISNGSPANTIVALTLDPGANVIVGDLTDLPVGAHAGYIYVDSIATWTRIS